MIDNKIATFAAYMAKPDCKYVLLMNAGTLPEYRRQGLHDYMVKYRVNKNLEYKSDATFYCNVEKGEGSYLGLKKLGFEEGELYYVYA